MIKCERNSKGKTSIEAQGNAMTVAADCCEIISAIYANLPPHFRQAFKTSVLLAVNHKDSPMWSTERKFDGEAGCVDITELKRQCGMSDEGGSSVTRVDLTVQQCRALGEYLRNRVDRGMGCGYEHDCSIHGCRIMRVAAERLEQLTGAVGRQEVMVYRDGG